MAQRVQSLSTNFTFNDSEHRALENAAAGEWYEADGMWYRFFYWKRMTWEEAEHFC